MAWRSLISAARRAISNSQSLAFSCRPDVAPGLPQEWLSNSEWGLGREVVPFYAAQRDGGPLRKGEWKFKVLKMPG